jgi:hypothetical protein
LALSKDASDLCTEASNMSEKEAKDFAEQTIAERTKGMNAFWLKALLPNFKQVGKDGELTRGSLAFQWAISIRFNA